jgi:hypothetical protein
MLKKAREYFSRLAETVPSVFKRFHDQGQRSLEDMAPKMKTARGEWKKSAREWTEASKEFGRSARDKTKEQARGMIDRVKYSKEKMDELQSRIKYQGGFYRELCKSRRSVELLSLGGEALVTLSAAASIPQEIQDAYEAAYPDKAQMDGLADELNRFSGDELTGFLAGIKGKLFELQYVEYLNDGNLPAGYTAHIAESATQKGWDIAIEGPNEGLIEVIQAKATDSVGYVLSALRENPYIDVVTTDEVYSSLVMSGASESVLNSGITNASLEDALTDAEDHADLSMDFTPPWFTLAIIAFTTYKAEDLTLFEKARSAGDRTGKTYLSYLLGGTLAAVTNTWWLGVVGSVASRFIADEGARRRAVFEKMKSVAKKNDEIIIGFESRLKS